MLYRGTIAKALREELGSVRLTDLSAADVQKALTSIASRVSTRTVQIAHNVLVRAIRQAEQDDLVGRNVASLVKPPKGQGAGRPSKSLTLEQAVSLMAAARGTRLEAYIVLSLLSGMRTEEARALRWDHVVAWVGGQWVPVADAGFDHEQVAVFVWRAERAGVTPRRRSPGGRWRCRVSAWRRCGNTGCGRRRTGSRPGRCGRTRGWCSRRR
jgi:integrase